MRGPASLLTPFSMTVYSRNCQHPFQTQALQQLKTRDVRVCLTDISSVLGSVIEGKGETAPFLESQPEECDMALDLRSSDMNEACSPHESLSSDDTDLKSYLDTNENKSRKRRNKLQSQKGVSNRRISVDSDSSHHQSLVLISDAESQEAHNNGHFENDNNENQSGKLLRDTESEGGNGNRCRSVDVDSISQESQKSELTLEFPEFTAVNSEKCSQESHKNQSVGKDVLLQESLPTPVVDETSQILESQPNTESERNVKDTELVQNSLSQSFKDNNSTASELCEDRNSEFSGPDFSLQNLQDRKSPLLVSDTIPAKPSVQEIDAGPDVPVNQDIWESTKRLKNSDKKQAQTSPARQYSPRTSKLKCLVFLKEVTDSKRQSEECSINSHQSDTHTSNIAMQKPVSEPVKSVLIKDILENAKVPIVELKKLKVSANSLVKLKQSKPVDDKTHIVNSDSVTSETKCSPRDVSPKAGNRRRRGSRPFSDGGFSARMADKIYGGSKDKQDVQQTVTMRDMDARPKTEQECTGIKTCERNLPLATEETCGHGSYILPHGFRSADLCTSTDNQPEHSDIDSQPCRLGTCISEDDVERTVSIVPSKFQAAKKPKVHFKKVKQAFVNVGASESDSVEHQDLSEENNGEVPYTSVSRSINVDEKFAMKTENQTSKGVKDNIEVSSEPVVEVGSENLSDSTDGEYQLVKPEDVTILQKWTSMKDSDQHTDPFDSCSRGSNNIDCYKDCILTRRHSESSSDDEARHWVVGPHFKTYGQKLHRQSYMAKHNSMFPPNKNKENQPHYSDISADETAVDILSDSEFVESHNSTGGCVEYLKQKETGGCIMQNRGTVFTDKSPVNHISSAQVSAGFISTSFSDVPWQRDRCSDSTSSAGSSANPAQQILPVQGSSNWNVDTDKGNAKQTEQNHLSFFTNTENSFIANNPVMTKCSNQTVKYQKQVYPAQGNLEGTSNDSIVIEGGSGRSQMTCVNSLGTWSDDISPNDLNLMQTGSNLPCNNRVTPECGGYLENLNSQKTFNCENGAFAFRNINSVSCSSVDFQQLAGYCDAADSSPINKLANMNAVWMENTDVSAYNPNIRKLDSNRELTPIGGLRPEESMPPAGAGSADKQTTTRQHVHKKDYIELENVSRVPEKSLVSVLLKETFSSDQESNNLFDRERRTKVTNLDSEREINSDEKPDVKLNQSPTNSRSNNRENLVKLLLDKTVNMDSQSGEVVGTVNSGSESKSAQCEGNTASCLNRNTAAKEKSSHVGKGEFNDSENNTDTNFVKFLLNETFNSNRGNESPVLKEEAFDKSSSSNGEDIEIRRQIIENDAMDMTAVASVVPQHNSETLTDVSGSSVGVAKTSALSSSDEGSKDSVSTKSEDLGEFKMGEDRKSVDQDSLERVTIDTKSSVTTTQKKGCSSEDSVTSRVGSDLIYQRNQSNIFEISFENDASKAITIDSDSSDCDNDSPVLGTQKDIVSNLNSSVGDTDMSQTVDCLSEHLSSADQNIVCETRSENILMSEVAETGISLSGQTDVSTCGLGKVDSEEKIPSVCESVNENFTSPVQDDCISDSRQITTKIVCDLHQSENQQATADTADNNDKEASKNPSDNNIIKVNEGINSMGQGNSDALSKESSFSPPNCSHTTSYSHSEVTIQEDVEEFCLKRELVHNNSHVSDVTKKAYLSKVETECITNATNHGSEESQPKRPCTPDDGPPQLVKELDGSVLQEGGHLSSDEAPVEMFDTAPVLLPFEGETLINQCPVNIVEEDSNSHDRGSDILDLSGKVYTSTNDSLDNATKSEKTNDLIFIQDSFIATDHCQEEICQDGVTVCVETEDVVDLSRCYTNKEVQYDSDGDIESPLGAKQSKALDELVQPQQQEDECSKSSSDVQATRFDLSGAVEASKPFIERCHPEIKTFSDAVIIDLPIAIEKPVPSPLAITKNLSDCLKKIGQSLKGGKVRSSGQATTLADKKEKLRLKREEKQQLQHQQQLKDPVSPVVAKRFENAFDMLNSALHQTKKESSNAPIANINVHAKEKKRRGKKPGQMNRDGKKFRSETKIHKKRKSFEGQAKRSVDDCVSFPYSNNISYVNSMSTVSSERKTRHISSSTEGTVQVLKLDCQEHNLTMVGNEKLHIPILSDCKIRRIQEKLKYRPSENSDKALHEVSDTTEVFLQELVQSNQEEKIEDDEYVSQGDSEVSDTETEKPLYLAKEQQNSPEASISIDLRGFMTCKVLSKEETESSLAECDNRESVFTECIEMKRKEVVSTHVVHGDKETAEKSGANTHVSVPPKSANSVDAFHSSNLIQKKSQERKERKSKDFGFLFGSGDIVISSTKVSEKTDKSSKDTHKLKGIPIKNEADKLTGSNNMKEKAKWHRERDSQMQNVKQRRKLSLKKTKGKNVSDEHILPHPKNVSDEHILPHPVTENLRPEETPIANRPTRMPLENHQLSKELDIPVKRQSLNLSNVSPDKLKQKDYEGDEKHYKPRRAGKKEKIMQENKRKDYSQDSSRRRMSSTEKVQIIDPRVKVSKTSQKLQNGGNTDSKWKEATMVKNNSAEKCIVAKNTKDTNVAMNNGQDVSVGVSTATNHASDSVSPEHIHQCNSINAGVEVVIHAEHQSEESEADSSVANEALLSLSGADDPTERLASESQSVTQNLKGSTQTLPTKCSEEGMNFTESSRNSGGDKDGISVVVSYLLKDLPCDVSTVTKKDSHVSNEMNPSPLTDAKENNSDDTTDTKLHSEASGNLEPSEATNTGLFKEPEMDVTEGIVVGENSEFNSKNKGILLEEPKSGDVTVRDCGSESCKVYSKNEGIPFEKPASNDVTEGNSVDEKSEMHSKNEGISLEETESDDVIERGDNKNTELTSENEVMFVSYVSDSAERSSGSSTLIGRMETGDPTENQVNIDSEKVPFCDPPEVPQTENHIDLITTVPLQNVEEVTETNKLPLEGLGGPNEEQCLGMVAPSGVISPRGICTCDKNKMGNHDLVGKDSKCASVSQETGSLSDEILLHVHTQESDVQRCTHTHSAESCSEAEGKELVTNMFSETGKLSEISSSTDCDTVASVESATEQHYCKHQKKKKKKRLKTKIEKNSSHVNSVGSDSSSTPMSNDLHTARDRIGDETDVSNIHYQSETSKDSYIQTGENSLVSESCISADSDSDKTVEMAEISSCLEVRKRKFSNNTADVTFGSPVKRPSIDVEMEHSVCSIQMESEQTNRFENSLKLQIEKSRKSSSELENEVELESVQVPPVSAEYKRSSKKRKLPNRLDSAFCKPSSSRKRKLAEKKKFIDTLSVLHQATVDKLKCDDLNSPSSSDTSNEQFVSIRDLECIGGSEKYVSPDVYAQNVNRDHCVNYSDVLSKLAYLSSVRDESSQSPPSTWSPSRDAMEQCQIGTEPSSGRVTHKYGNKPCKYLSSMHILEKYANNHLVNGHLNEAADTGNSDLDLSPEIPMQDNGQMSERSQNQNNNDCSSPLSPVSPVSLHSEKYSSHPQSPEAEKQENVCVIKKIPGSPLASDEESPASPDKEQNDHMILELKEIPNSPQHIDNNSTYLLTVGDASGDASVKELPDTGCSETEVLQKLKTTRGLDISSYKDIYRTDHSSAFAKVKKFPESRINKNEYESDTQTDFKSLSTNHQMLNLSIETCPVSQVVRHVSQTTLKEADLDNSVRNVEIAKSQTGLTPDGPLSPLPEYSTDNTYLREIPSSPKEVEIPDLIVEQHNAPGSPDIDNSSPYKVREIPGFPMDLVQIKDIPQSPLENTADGPLSPLPENMADNIYLREIPSSPKVETASLSSKKELVECAGPKHIPGSPVEECDAPLSPGVEEQSSPPQLIEIPGIPVELLQEELWLKDKDISLTGGLSCVNNSEQSQIDSPIHSPESIRSPSPTSVRSRSPSPKSLPSQRSVNKLKSKPVEIPLTMDSDNLNPLPASQSNLEIQRKHKRIGHILHERMKLMSQLKHGVSSPYGSRGANSSNDIQRYSPKKLSAGSRVSEEGTDTDTMHATSPTNRVMSTEQNKEACLTSSCNSLIQHVYGNHEPVQTYTGKKDKNTENSDSSNAERSTGDEDKSSEKDPWRQNSGQGSGGGQRRQFRNVDTHCIITPLRPPPSRRFVIEDSLRQGIIPEYGAFCSNPEDVPGRPR